MDKNKRIWLVIASILVIGIAVTFTTSSFIERNGGSLNQTAVQRMPQTAAAQGTAPPYTEAESKDSLAAAKGRAGGAPSSKEKEKKADNSREASVKIRAVPETAGESDSGAAAAPAANVPNPAAEGVPVPESKAAVTDEKVTLKAASTDSDSNVAPVISPLEPVPGSVSGKDPEAKQAYYEKRLAELDAQIQNMRSESTDSTTYSMKTLAEKELKLWNNEMNGIYAEIAKELDDESKQKLESSQQAWLKNRDTKAEETARKYSGGTLEGVEYTASLADSTRARAYALIDEYISVLPAENED